jgi:zinc transport system ATP-binding protein
MPQLSCHNLTLAYDGKTILCDLSFAAEAGDYLCIVGENGCGKSTLMKTLLRLKAPESGHVELGDGLTADQIGYLPQQTVVQKDFPATVREVVRSGCLNQLGLRPFYGLAERQRMQENLQRLGIAHIAKSCYRELSGGQQQRVLLARALCATRQILLLDEPAAGLDPAAAADLYAIIKQLNQSGITIIMISHDIAASVQYASHILHLGRQGILFYGRTQDYLHNEASRVYLWNT